jgi:hypothetical protein
MNLARIARWSLVLAPMIAGVALLIFGTAGGISTGFGITLIGIGPMVWLWNWFIRMAFTEEADKRAALEREREEREREQRERRDAKRHVPPPDPHVHRPTSPPATEKDPSRRHERPRSLGRSPRRRPH